MGRKSKLLKFIDDKYISEENTSEQKDDVFFDFDNENSNETYRGHYIMTKLNESEVERKIRPRRIYLFRWGYNFRDIEYNNVFRYFITNKRYKYNSLVKVFLEEYFKEKKSSGLTVSIINGLRLFLRFLEKNKKDCPELYYVNQALYVETLEYHERIKANKTVYRNLREFFSLLSKKIE